MNVKRVCTQIGFNDLLNTHTRKHTNLVLSFLHQLLYTVRISIFAAVIHRPNGDH